LILMCWYKNDTVQSCIFHRDPNRRGRRADRFWS
jgi:hypothetical protein